MMDPNSEADRDRILREAAKRERETLRLPSVSGGSAMTYMKEAGEKVKQPAKEPREPFWWLGYYLLVCALILVGAITVWAAAWFIQWAPL